MPANTNKTNMLYISRHGKTNGWQVRRKATRNSDEVSKFFADSAFGSRKGSLAVATRWRNRNLVRA